MLMVKTAVLSLFTVPVRVTCPAVLPLELTRKRVSELSPGEKEWKQDCYSKKLTVQEVFLIAQWRTIKVDSHDQLKWLECSFREASLLFLWCGHFKKPSLEGVHFKCVASKGTSHNPLVSYSWWWVFSIHRSNIAHFMLKRETVCFAFLGFSGRDLH